MRKHVFDPKDVFPFMLRIHTIKDELTNNTTTFDSFNLNLLDKYGFTLKMQEDGTFSYTMVSVSDEKKFNWFILKYL